MTRPRGKAPTRRRPATSSGSASTQLRTKTNGALAANGYANGTAEDEDGVEAYETSGVCPCCSHPSLPVPQLQLSNVLSGIFLRRLEWDILRLYATRIYWISKKKL
ncbi:hypothetical protein BT69DRAFT_1306466, partial [Atractiella rhizophila]